MNNKKISIGLIITSFIFIIIGSTFAFWNWQSVESQRTTITFAITSKFSCAADGGGDITSNDVILAPCSCTNGTYAIKRELSLMPEIISPTTIYMDIWLDINSIGTGLANSENFRYAVTKSPDSCENPISSGNFYGLTSGDKVRILKGRDYNETTTDKYYLWIWLDSAETSSTTMNQSFSFSLNGSCDDVIPSTPNEPVLTNGLIPVTISKDGKVKTVSETDTLWYDYDEKEWANAVLVSETNRSTYQDSTGVTIPESDILAYYVWIPRYKYQIWTTETSAAGKEEGISIVFETKDEISTGSKFGEYITHPAFWWDSDSDGVREEGEELSGIWVGKFETSTDTSSTCYTSASSDNCNNTDQSPRIKPNVYSLRYQTVSNQFQTILKFSGGTLSDGIVTFNENNIYGLSSSVNSHMLKNSEWGAVAYLSHSKYGIGTEIRINNNYNYTTGCGASTANAGSTSSCQIAYGSGVTEYPQSTTGNITGIFDMSGGAWEYVMGNYNGTIGSYSGFSTLPESKYYDKYTTTSALTACNGGICYGHALSETSRWYSDSAVFVSSSFPWFERGGYCNSGSSAGAFDFYYYDGNAHNGDGVRAALLPDGA